MRYLEVELSRLLAVIVLSPVLIFAYPLYLVWAKADYDPDHWEEAP